MMDTVSNPSGGPWAGVGLACALGFLGFAVGRQYEKRNNTTKGRTVATEEASAAKNGDSNCGGGATTRSSAGEGDAATPSGALKTAPFGSSKKVANILRSESENVPNLNEMQKLGEGGPGDKEQEATPVANTFLGREITTDDDVPSSKTLPLTKSGNMIVPHSPLSRHRSLSRTSSNAHDLLNAISETTQTAINSSEMTEEKNREHSFLLYSLYGTYFYPGYLYNRFSERRNHHDKLEKLATLLGKKYLEAQRLLQQVGLVLRFLA
ncbi:unnamed protein product [Amoebophrya sp. A25]|nr:unnamed protein product [Amoebophrya sp. A25]|eukprot:GSA25T00008121001.1